jgi:hypothetical protein
VSTDIQKMLKQSGNPEKTGICCINMGWDVPDKNIRAILHTVDEYRKQFTKH